MQFKLQAMCAFRFMHKHMIDNTYYIHDDDDDDDDDDETWIYIAHRHKISNALNTLVLRQKECLQHLFEGRFCIAGFSDIVRQQVPNSETGDSKCPTAMCSAVVPWYVKTVTLG